MYICDCGFVAHGLKMLRVHQGKFREYSQLFRDTKKNMKLWFPSEFAEYDFRHGGTFRFLTESADRFPKLKDQRKGPTHEFLENRFLIMVNNQAKLKAIKLTGVKEVLNDEQFE